MGGNQFTLGINLAKPDGGGGVSGGYTIQEPTKSYSIPDWGVENRTSGNELHSTWRSRHPCQVNIGLGLDRDSCFPASNSRQPPLPNALSRSQMQVHAKGRWATKKLIEASEPALSFRLSTPVYVFDAYCGHADALGESCGGSSNQRWRPFSTGPFDHVISFDPSKVNPIPFDRILVFKEAADGEAHEEVRAFVRLRLGMPSAAAFTDRLRPLQI